MPKGQLLPFAFLIFLVAGIMISYIFFNFYYGTSYNIQTLLISTVDAIGNLAQSFKNYLKLSLAYSDQQSLREHACTGGTVGAAPWIVNGPNPVEVQQSKECLEKYTLYYFNVYLDMFDTSLPVEIKKYNYTQNSYGVDEAGVFSGIYDEGYYWVNSSDGVIVISGINRNVTLVDNLNNSDFVTKNRYWYMFRNFYDWAMADVYSPCICSVIGCSCSSSSGMEQCSSCSDPTNNCAKTALNDLKNRFDGDVKCRMDKLCCNQGIGPPCQEGDECLPWTEENTCLSKNDHQCINPSIGERPCPIKSPKTTTTRTTTTTLSTKSSSPYTNLISSSNPFAEEGNESTSYCLIWIEGRVAAGYRYTCEDFKYYVPSDKGTVPLTFIVNAYAFFRYPKACMGYTTCPGCEQESSTTSTTGTTIPCGPCSPGECCWEFGCRPC